MPPLGPKDGEKTDRDGEDSVWRKECWPLGVAGSSVTLLEKDLSKPGVRMVRFAGFRRELLCGIRAVDGGAAR